ncbi:MAG: murE [Gammaproteobacteria bacterium]|nr:murE [Gammaproteobacteria bacterium]
MMVLAKSTSGVLLETLLAGLADGATCGQIRVNGLSMDSRKTGPGDLFLACHGTRTSGVHFLRDAVKAGAGVIVAEADAGLQRFFNEVPVITVSDLRTKIGIIAARFHDHPSAKMRVIGVTGTNGKTSVSCFIAQALAEISSHKVGLIGTLGYGPYQLLHAGPNTTPDPVTVQSTLADFYRQGIDTVVMEVTSIGLDQGRVRGVDFNIGIFTNLTIDHLDYHGDIDTYAEAKKQLFTSHEIRHAIINIDDTYGRRLFREIATTVPVTGYGLVDQFSVVTVAADTSMVQAMIEEDDPGMTLAIKSSWGEAKLPVAIGGRYNAYNLLASLAALCVMGIPFPQAIERLSQLSPVPGRMEKFGSSGRPTVFVDYAHTPDALQHALTYVKSQTTGKLVCVFGCGGNRDRSKRPQMGAIAETYADRVVLTNDNPRHEDPQAIIAEILNGISDRGRVRVELDRNKAITDAIQSAGADDMILVAGKGHEAYQEIAGQRYPFSDRQLVRQLLGAEA